MKKLEPLTRSLDDVEGRITGTFDDKDDTHNTVAIITGEQLNDPDASGTDVKTFDAYGGGAFLRCTRWTGPKNPMAGSVLSERDGDGLKKECEAAQNIKTVIVTSTVASETPRLLENGTFSGGRAEICVTAFDWASSKVIARFTVTGEPDAKVEYTVRPGDSKKAEVAESVHSSMWVDARKKLFDGLKQRGVTLRTN